MTKPPKLEISPRFIKLTVANQTVGSFFNHPIQIDPNIPPCPSCSSNQTMEVRSDAQRVLGCFSCGQITKSPNDINNKPT